MAMASMPAAQSTQESKYQRLRVSVVSATGAQKNFQTLGNMPAAMSSAPCSTVRPARVARKASAALTNPKLAPNGAISTV